MEGGVACAKVEILVKAWQGFMWKFGPMKPPCMTPDILGVRLDVLIPLFLIACVWVTISGLLYTAMTNMYLDHLPGPDQKPYLCDHNYMASNRNWSPRARESDFLTPISF